jgi:undecaprenyl diphosphate synthase
LDLKKQINIEKLPKHISIIMDGNGRWAKSHSKLRVFGHEQGVKAVKTVTTAAAELGIEFLTLYAFSTENWNRPKFEVNALMRLLVKTIRNETKTLMDNNIRLRAIGDLSKLPKDCQSQLKETMDITENNSKMTLILALNYGAQWDLTNASKLIAEKVKKGELSPEDIHSETIKQHLSTADFPDPELLIRTSGEARISNFLLWEIAYAEFYFTETLWPDFGEKELHEAVYSFQNRERRFGKTSEQLISAEE